MKNQPIPGTLKHLPSFSSKGAGCPLPCNVSAEETRGHYGRPLTYLEDSSLHRNVLVVALKAFRHLKMPLAQNSLCRNMRNPWRIISLYS